MKTVDRVQGLIDVLNESRDEDGRVSLHSYDVDMFIKDLEVVKQEIKEDGNE